MSVQTQTYNFHCMETGDKWYPGYDQRNMMTVENQISGLIQFVGPGVLTGWEVLPMSLTGDYFTDQALIAERQTLITADTYSPLGRQYAGMSSPVAEWEWGQCVKVTPGTGIVGLYPAATKETVYFRYTANGIYYIWAESSVCLSTQGIARINFPLDGDPTRNTYTTATYLASVEIVTYNLPNDSPDAGPKPQINPFEGIVYGDQRNDLAGLAGALQQALKLSFYRHKHLGGEDHPSKIDLSSQITLTASGPAGSTIFLLLDSSGKVFHWASATDTDDGSAAVGGLPVYGVPVVLLNDEALPTSNYTLDPPNGKLYLTNSVAAGAALQVVLPKSPQTYLTLYPGSLMSDTVQFLTDGKTVYDPTSNTTVERHFFWDDGEYLAPEVYLAGILVDPSLYIVRSDQGSVAFTEPPSFYEPIALLVILTRIGIQVKGKLPGTRITDVDASQFTTGTLDPRRIAGLDHVGQVRFKETCSLRPSLRLLSAGDHDVYFPERFSATNLLEYDADIHFIQSSQNISGQLLGTKRGLFQTTDGVSALFAPGWNRDFGVPVAMIDDILQDDPGTNEFATTYVLTLEGVVYYTPDSGTSWRQLKMPVVVLPGGMTAIPTVTSFWVSTDRLQETSPTGLITYKWYTVMWLGTNYGLWHKRYELGTTQDEVSWDEALENDPSDPHTINSVVEIVTLQRTVSDDGSVQESYDRSWYAGVSGTNLGFYVNSIRISSTLVPLGLLWLRGSVAANQILFWTTDSVYLSHTAWLDESSDDTSTTTQWHHPLTPTGLVFPGNSQLQAVRAATTGSNITLSGLQVIDNVSLASGDRILVKDQTIQSQNGVYTVSSSAWSRSVDQANASQIAPDQWTTVTSGTTNGGSLWVMTSLAHTLGSVPMIWGEYWARPLSNLAQPPTQARERVTTGEYYIFTPGIPYRLTDRIDNTKQNAWLPALTTTVSTWLSSQGAPRDLFEASSTVLYFASALGLWKTDATTDSFVRLANSLTSLSPAPTIYDETSGALITDPATVNLTSQAVIFGTSRTVWQNMLMEKDYTNYYTAPWNPTGAEVVVYIQGQPSTLPYSLDPATGLIQFDSSLDKDAVVQITIVRLGAFISDVGNTPHEELPLSYVTAASAVTTLAVDLAVDSQLIVVATPSAVPVDTEYIELQAPAGNERIAVTVNPSTLQITAILPRKGAIVFPANETQVFLVSLTTILGIEDELSLYQSNQTYHLNSVGGVNTLQLTIAAKAQIPALFNAWDGGNSGLTGVDRGPKNALFFDFTTDAIDATSSASTLYEGLDPSDGDSPQEPQVAYAIYAPAVNGNDTRLGTDAGIWRYDASLSTWRKEGDLSPASRVYFIQSIDGNLNAGTDAGLWVQSDNDLWTLNPTYPQGIFDHISGSAFGGTFEAWGKQDGLAFIRQTQGQTGFTSDHFDPLDGLHVYGLWYGQYITLTGDPPVQNKFDALYLCTEDGVWAVALGDRGGQYSSLLKGRDMFLDANGNSLLRIPIKLPDGSTTTAPVKAYRIFQAPALPPNYTAPVPIFICTSNGVYKIRDWRWCDPTGSDNSSTFTIEQLGMAGIASYCSDSLVNNDSTGIYSKIFVGGEKGVWRSFDEGVTWQRCERIVDGRDIPVYDLKIVGAGMWVGTSEGLFYSEDEGDTWSPPAADGNSTADFSPNISNAILLGGSSQAQTFISDETTLTKFSLYLSSVTLDPTDPALPAALNNTVSVALYAVNGQGNPSGSPLATSTTTLRAGDITYPTFYPFELASSVTVTIGHTYALVATETIADGAGSTSMIQWSRSSQYSPYVRGKRISGTGSGSVTWTAIPSDDFFFRVFQAAPVVPRSIANDAGISSVPGIGTVVTDNGALTTDFKFAVAAIIDDSHSALWGDPVLRRGTQALGLVTDLQNHTTVSGLVKTYADVWVTQTDSTERTNGFVADNALLTTAFTALYQRGLTDVLFDTIDIAITGLSPQSIVDALIQVGDDTGNTTRIAELVTYLGNTNQLRLADVVTYWQELPDGTRSDWDNQADTISVCDDVSQFVAERWAQTFIPLGIIVSDGDGDGNAPTIVVTAQTAWNGFGAVIHSFGTGRDARESGVRSIASGTGGKHFDITDESDADADWVAARASLLPGGQNDLFHASWSNAFDFDDPVFVQEIDAVYSTPTGNVKNSACTVTARWTKDRLIWSSWQTITSGSAFAVGDLVLGLEFQVTLQGGYDSSSGQVSPTLTSLTYTSVTPSIQYLLTPAENDSSGTLFEYLLSAAVDVPSSAVLTWGIVRGDSIDFADFEPVINGRKACLSNRQESIQFSTAIVRTNLPAGAIDATFQTYRVTDSGATVFWSTSDVVQVFVQVGVSYVLLDPARARYALDGTQGLIYFETAQLAAQQFVVTITTPPSVMRVVGEPTTTGDEKTYCLSGGRWPHDATVIVLINNQIQRGGYFLNAEEGTVTFDRELQRTDIVTVYVQNASTFRVGVEIQNYSSDPVELTNFGLIYTEKQNTGLVAAYNNSEPPVITGLSLLPASATVYQRLTVNYTFFQKDGNVEYGTKITWYRKRVAESVFTAIGDYTDRITQKSSDVGDLSFLAQGDSVYVMVTPSDVIRQGNTYVSPTLVMQGNQIPVVLSVSISATSKVETPVGSGTFYAAAGDALVALYAQTDGDDGPDRAVVSWYAKDGPTPVYVGKSIPANFTLSGQAISVTVTPYDGQDYGIPMTSEYVTIQ